MIDIQLVRNVELGLSTTLSDSRQARTHIWELSCNTTQSPEIIRTRFERMDDTVWSDATRQELRINPYVRARIYHDRAGKQSLLQKMTLRAIDVRFENTIRNTIGRKGVFVGFVSDPTENVGSPH